MIIPFNYLIELASKANREDVLISKYAAWSKLDKIDEEKFRLIGKLEENFDSSHDDQDYWSPKSIIALNKYPYSGCSVYENTEFQTIYLIYRDFGGHVPEMRCRFADNTLMKL